MAQISMFEDIPTRATDDSEIPIGTRVAVKRTGSGGTVVAFDTENYAEPMYIVDIGVRGEAGRAILRRREIHTAHALSWFCRCYACTTARTTLGRAMAGG